MDPILVHRRTLLGRALLGGALLLAKVAVPVAARPVPPFRRGEPALFGTCRSIQNKYKEMEGQARGETDRAIREQIEADMKKLDLAWRSQGCQGEFAAIAVARIPFFPGGPLGPNPVAPGSGQQEVVGGGSSPKPATGPDPVAPGGAGLVRVKGRRRGKRRR